MELMSPRSSRSKTNPNVAPGGASTSTKDIELATIDDDKPIGGYVLAVAKQYSLRTIPWEQVAFTDTKVGSVSPGDR